MASNLRKGLAVLLSASLLSLSAINPAHASVGVGTPLGPPDPTPAVSTTPVSGGGVVVTTTTVSWTVPPSNGGSPITSYVATVYGKNPTSPPSAPVYSVPTSYGCTSTDAAVLNCTVSSMPYNTNYIVKVVVQNALGISAPTASAVFTTPSQSQTVTIDGQSNATVAAKAYGSADFQLVGAATSSLPVTWQSDYPAVCSVDSSGVVHLLLAGSNCIIRAIQDGSGSQYSYADTTQTIPVVSSPAGVTESATNIQGNQATLNATVNYSGATSTVVFCAATTNPGATPTTCPSIGTIAAASPSTVNTSTTTSTATSALITGLTSSTPYFFWAKITSGTTVYTTPSTFTTISGPSITFSGSTALTQGSPYTSTLTASSGAAPYGSWSVATGPTGLMLTADPSGTTAIFAGTPTTLQTSTATFTVYDANGLFTSINVSFVVSAPVATPPSGGGGGGGGSPAPTPTPTTPTTPIATIPVTPGPELPPTQTKPVTPTPTISGFSATINNGAINVIAVLGAPAKSTISITKGTAATIASFMKFSIDGQNLRMVPTATASGKYTFNIEIEINGVVQECIVTLTILPEGFLNPKLLTTAPPKKIYTNQFVPVKTTLFAYLPKSATGINVEYNGAPISWTVNEFGSILIPVIVGPLDKLYMGTIGKDGTKSPLVLVQWNQNPVPISLANVNFAFNDTTLTKVAKRVLDNAIKQIIAHGFKQVSLTGHTDNVGVYDKNIILSKKRAAVVKAYVVKKLTAAHVRITMQGLADTVPVKSNKSDGGRAINRRVEILVQ